MYIIQFGKHLTAQFGHMVKVIYHDQVSQCVYYSSVSSYWLTLVTWSRVLMQTLSPQFGQQLTTQFDHNTMVKGIGVSQK